MATTTGPRPTRVLGANLDKERARIAQQGRLKAIAKLAGVLTTNDRTQDLRGEELRAVLETISKLAGGSPDDHEQFYLLEVVAIVEAVLDICDDAALMVSV